MAQELIFIKRKSPKWADFRAFNMIIYLEKNARTHNIFFCSNSFRSSRIICVQNSRFLTKSNYLVTLSLNNLIWMNFLSTLPNHKFALTLFGYFQAEPHVFQWIFNPKLMLRNKLFEWICLRFRCCCLRRCWFFFLLSLSCLYGWPHLIKWNHSISRGWNPISENDVKIHSPADAISYLQWAEWATNYSINVKWFVVALTNYQQQRHNE